MTGDGGRPRMRYPASEKLEIIGLVEGSHLSARLTLAKIGIPRIPFGTIWGGDSGWISLQITTSKFRFSIAIN